MENEEENRKNYQEHNYFNELPSDYKTWMEFYDKTLKNREFETGPFGVQFGFGFGVYDHETVPITDENHDGFITHFHKYKFSSVDFVKAKCFDELMSKKFVTQALKFGYD